MVGSSRFCSWVAVPAPVCTWQTFRLVGVDNLRGANWPRVLHVRRVFLSVFVSICVASYFWQGEFGRPSAWTSRIIRAAPVARGPSEDRARTVRYSRCTTGGSASFFKLSVCDPRTIRPYHADFPPGASQSC
jgi:hypothetical protein